MTALRAGASLIDASRYCGLNPATVEKWLQRGRGVDRDRPATPEYQRFARLVDENRAAVRVYVVSNVVKLSAKDPRAAEIWLKRYGGSEWRDDGPVPLPSGQTTVIDNREQQMNVLVLDAEELPEVVRGILAAKRASRTDVPISDDIDEPHDGPSGTRDSGLREDG